MKHMLATVFAFAAAVAFADPATYYVDERGDDSWTGTASYDDRDESVTPVKGPKKTLKEVMKSVVKTTSADQVGDTVYIYPGDYRGDGTQKYCAALPDGCRLIGVGDKADIRIHGSGTSWDNKETEAADSAAMRCLSLGKWTLVKGVTLRGGRFAGNGACATGGTGGFIVDCVLTENYIAKDSSNKNGQGGALSSGAIPIRCLFLKNASAANGAAMYNGSAWNCVFDPAGAGGYAVYKTTTYNCTYASGGYSNREGTFVNCLYNGNQYQATVDANSIKVTPLQLDTGYVLPAGSAAVDYGNNDSYLNAFPTSDLVADQKYLDFNGRQRIFNGTIDAGATEYQAVTATVNVNDANGGLVVSGIEPGVATVIDPGVTSVTISRNNSTVKHCEGITVNGEFFSFTGESADLVYTHVFDGTASETLNVTAVYSSANQWYVATTGNDANAGDAPYRAKRTLAGAMGIANLAANDVVHVAEGTYDSGEMWDGTCSNRLYVTKGVGIVADGTKERTIIMGKADSAATSAQRECTINSVRCVNIGNRYAYLKGFTITGGRAIAGAGGIFNSVENRAAVVDCIITNNAANNSTGLEPKAGGVNNAVCIGCYFDDNLLNGGAAATGGSAGWDSSYINCRIAGGNIYASAVVLNCRLDNASGTSDNGKVTYRNCVVLKSKSYYEKKGIVFDNCLFADDVPGLAGMFDENLAPKYGTVPVDYSESETDATATYNDMFPGTWARFKNVGYGGGQRIYNGKIDIGPVEYDWRGEFAKRLKGRSLSVAEATANVTTNAISGVTLSDGDSIAIDWMLQREGEYSFNVAVSGAGSASVTIDGEAASVLGGVCSFTVGEGETGSTKRIVVAFTGEGSATVSGFSSPKTGLMVIVR